MYLLNEDRVVLEFDFDDMYLEVHDNQFLPYALKDYLVTSSYDTKELTKRSMRHVEVLRDYLAGRTLNLSRDNAKAILGSVSLPQVAKTAERLKIVMACQGLTMTDNFWVKEKDDSRTFSEVCLRNKHLADGAFPISILGKQISVTKDILQPDLATDGMYAKTWYRGQDGIELWKTDSTGNFINTRKEVEVSEFLDYTNVSHVHYELSRVEDVLIAKCKCIANDEYSIINAFELKDWCNHTGIDFMKFLERFRADVAKMCTIDYVIANTDRHLGNINFMVSNRDNQIAGLAPLFDHNQALIADEVGTEVDDLIYDFTGDSMLQTALMYYPQSGLEIDIARFPEKCQERFQKLVEEI